MSKKKMKGYIRGAVLVAITLMAGYLVFCSVGVIDLPEWDGSWLLVQICMFSVGMGWLVLFGAANGAFDDLEDDEEWDF